MKYYFDFELLSVFCFSQVKLQSLLLKLQRQDSEQQPVQNQNGQIDENTEPINKRRKTIQNENSEDSSSANPGGVVSGNGVTAFPVLSSELKVYDKNIK